MSGVSKFVSHNVMAGSCELIQENVIYNHKYVLFLHFTTDVYSNVKTKKNSKTERMGYDEKNHCFQLM